MEKDLKNKVAVVTGGANGIGLQIAEKFLCKGVKNVVILDIDKNNGELATKKLKEKFGESKVEFKECDVRKDLERVSEEIFSKYKTVDILVNNAGWAREKSVRDTFDVNTIAVIEWTEKFYSNMSRAKGGKGGTVINIASMLGYQWLPCLVFYTASKFAVVGYTRSLGDSDNYEKTGVRVVAICPGLTRTCIFDRSDSINSDEEKAILFKGEKWQSADAVGNAAVEVYERADSGTIWQIEGAGPLEQVP